MKFRMTIGIVRGLKEWQKYIIQNLLEIRHEFVQLEYITAKSENEKKL